MAGSDSRFDPAKFRNGIHFAMKMGFPEDTQKQITWQWEKGRTFTKADSSGAPYEWKAASVASEVDISDMIVDCAVKFIPAATGNRVGGTTLGIMDTASAQVTMLDNEYDALVAHGNGKFPDRAVMDEAVYVVQIKAPPQGIFEVTVWEIFLQAIDES